MTEHDKDVRRSGEDLHFELTHDGLYIVRDLYKGRELLDPPEEGFERVADACVRCGGAQISREEDSNNTALNQLGCS